MNSLEGPRQQIQDRSVQNLNDREKNWFEVLPKSLSQQLIQRGYSEPQDVAKLLDFSLSSLKDPFLLKDLSKTVDRLYQAYVKQEHILIYGDYDMDGSSGLAMLVSALKNLGYNKVSFRQADRHLEGYGLHSQMIPEFVAQGVQLVLTVDVGITAFEACRLAREASLDVLVTDHHLTQDGKLPDAYSVVNPNQPGDDSGLGYLCGTGVAFYVLRALKRTFANQRTPHEKYDLRESLPYLLLATLTDMVPLKEDNRILIRHGLDLFLKTKNVSIVALREELLKFKSQLSAADVAIQFAPKLNALTRMECELKPATFLMLEDQKEAKRQAKRILEINEERSQEQAKAERLADQVQVAPEVFFFSSKEIHVGVLGLVATKMAQKWNRPTFISTMNEKQLMVGSARAPEGFSLVEILEGCRDILVNFGGHAAAAGFQYEISREPEFKKRLGQILANRSVQQDEGMDLQAKDWNQSPLLSSHEINLDFLRWIDLFEPYGKDFESFQFQLKNWIVEDLSWIKGRHLKCSLISAEGAMKKVTAWFFSATNVEFERLRIGGPFDFLAEIQRNEFRGQISPQLILRAVKERNS